MNCLQSSCVMGPEYELFAGASVQSSCVMGPEYEYFSHISALTFYMPGQ